VWFAHTPSAEGVATITTCSANRTYDTAMTVYSGVCGALTSLGCNDDGPPFCANPPAGFSGSTVVTFVNAGTTYLVQVGGFAGGTGTSDLTITLQAGPCLTPPPGGLAEGEPCGSDANGGCNMAFPAYTAIASGGVTLGDAWADANFRDTDWYEITVPDGGTFTWRGAGRFPLRLFILDGACPPAVLATNFAPPCTEVSISAVVSCAGTYHFFAGDNGFTGNPCGSGNNDYWAELSFVPAGGGGLPNDNCPCATVLPAPGTYPFTTVGATNDGPGSCGASNTSPDVWFRHTSALSGNLVLSTCGLTDMDTVLSAFTGCGGAEITCLDDFCGLQTEITVQAAAGIPVYFRVAGFGGEEGSGDISLAFIQAPPPANNDCANATAVGEGVFPYSNISATTDGPAPSCAPSGSDVWFLYTATISGTVSATTCSPNRTMDTVMMVYDAPCVGSELGCNDDGPPFCGIPGVPFSGSTVIWTATAGSSYLIQIGSYGDGGQGGSDLTIAAVVPCAFTPDPNGIPEGEPCGSDTNGGCNSAPPIYTDVTCNGTWTGSAWADANFRDTDWYRFTLTSTTTVTATSETAFDGVLFIVDGIDVCIPGVPAIAATSCGVPGTVSMSLAPGTYVIFVATSAFAGLPCGGDNNGYNVTIDIGAAPCTPPCPCDFNNDLILNSQDFFDFLGCFFTPGCDADFNNDTVVNSQDFFDFLACFFAPPPGCA
jgi:hypothetical protein